jgi:hypothetical protein
MHGALPSFASPRARAASEAGSEAPPILVRHHLDPQHLSCMFCSPGKAAVVRKMERVVRAEGDVADRKRQPHQVLVDVSIILRE